MTDEFGPHYLFPKTDFIFNYKHPSIKALSSQSEHPSCISGGFVELALDSR